MRRFAPAVLALILVSCSHAKHYQLKGQILGVNRDQQEVLVKHEEIPGFMMAMTMSYKARSAGMLDNVNAGDLITADLSVADGIGTLDSITKTGTAPPDVPAPSPLASGIVMMVKNGEPVPDQRFIDEDGKDTSLSEIRAGRPMALTFMYTKCPMPTYCPMMDRNFVEVQKAIAAKPGMSDKVRLLSVSFDPANDTPAVLKKHAAELHADPAIWRFVTTKDQDSIDKFAMSLGLTLVRGQAQDPNEIGHTLRTAIIDRDGKLVKTYTGNEWTPAQVIADLARLQ